MATRTIGSHGKSDGLTKEGPLYNLTLDEVQRHLGDLGKPLSSMHLDELIKSVWTSESENNQGITDQNTQIPSATASVSASESSMADQRRKTVFEVWQGFQKKKGIAIPDSNDINNSNIDNLDTKYSTHEKQPTLGEMTLEDFLAKAGILPESSKYSALETETESSVALQQQNLNSQPAQWMQYQTQQVQQQHVFIPGHHPGQQVIGDVAYPETQMTVSSDTQTPGRKRTASGDLMEKSVERRQKRMIKNRESAARSRARKQAYTHELENKVSRLEEENERLKREQEVEKALPYEIVTEQKYQLRRTSSALF